MASGVTVFQTKKCPYCYNHLGLDDQICYVCKKRVGKINPKTGMAKPPADWLSYVLSLLAFIALWLYIWWAFLP